MDVKGAPGTLSRNHLVRAYEVGPLGTAGPALLANMMQETAGHHATALGLSVERLTRDNITWVLSRMRILLNRFPESGEEITVVTWPSGIDRHTATRDFILYDASGEEVARATSAWVIFNLLERKMAPMPEFIGAAYPPEFPERALTFESRMLPKLRESEQSVTVVSRLSDLDINAHVNNVHFIEWVMETSCALGFEGHPVELDIQFRAECGAHQLLESKAVFIPESNGKKVIHSLDLQGQEIARAVTRWL